MGGGFIEAEALPVAHLGSCYCAPSLCTCYRSFLLPIEPFTFCPLHACAGNMLRLGMLPPPPGCAVVELGAGKGYLGLMLSDCWGGGTTGATDAPAATAVVSATAAAAPAAAAAEDPAAATTATAAVATDSTTAAGTAADQGGCLGPIVLLDCRGFKNKVRNKQRK